MKVKASCSLCLGGGEKIFHHLQGTETVPQREGGGHGDSDFLDQRFAALEPASGGEGIADRPP